MLIVRVVGSWGEYGDVLNREILFVGRVNGFLCDINLGVFMYRVMNKMKMGYFKVGLCLYLFVYKYIYNIYYI